MKRSEPERAFRYFHTFGAQWKCGVPQRGVAERSMYSGVFSVFCILQFFRAACGQSFVRLRGYHIFPDIVFFPLSSKKWSRWDYAYFTDGAGFVLLGTRHLANTGWRKAERGRKSLK